ncbi:MAG: putative metallopeptidase [Candidatus Pacearchaeota archaeon]
MKYEHAPDLKARLATIVKALQMNHIDLERVECLRSFGSSTKRTIARCHTIGKVMQKGMNVRAFYTIEFLEKFDKLSIHEKDKVIIHELLHIPKTFGGGFRQHDYVCEDNIAQLHRALQKHNPAEFSKPLNDSIKLLDFINFRR